MKQQYFTERVCCALRGIEKLDIEKEMKARLLRKKRRQSEAEIGCEQAMTQLIPILKKSLGLPVY